MSRSCFTMLLLLSLFLTLMFPTGHGRKMVDSAGPEVAVGEAMSREMMQLDYETGANTKNSHFGSGAPSLPQPPISSDSGDKF